jgi:hypothetical protein
MFCHPCIGGSYVGKAQNCIIVNHSSWVILLDSIDNSVYLRVGVIGWRVHKVIARELDKRGFRTGRDGINLGDLWVGGFDKGVEIGIVGADGNVDEVEEKHEEERT